MNNKYPLSYILVDDDEDDRMLIKMALKKAQKPLPIYEFSDGQELLDFLHYNSSIREDNDIHWLVVMDVNMPVLDGISTVKQIRQKEGWERLPVLILSTSGEPDIIEKAMQNGANGYIVKPDTVRKYVEIFDEFFAPWLIGPSAQN